MPSFQLDHRSSGILLHISSLFGPHAIGDLGGGARAFADFLGRAHQHWWQVLPVNPAGAGNSPYSGSSAFAGDPVFISIDDLVDEGLLAATEVPARITAPRVDYEQARRVKRAALATAFARFRPGREYERFVRDSEPWLGDYALFHALRDLHGSPWTRWPSALRTRDPSALAAARSEHERAIRLTMFEQFVFAQQWARLRLYCRERRIGLIGDIPIFVAHDSADVWSHQAQFTLRDDGELEHVSGVPPDFFSVTGQRWGTPLYRWKRMKRDGYAWWLDRIALLLERFDIVRLDHFIGFSRFWKIDAREPTAEHGTWTRGPGHELFRAIRARFGGLPFIAEDLGEVTPAVRRLRDDFELPGMRIFQFSFGTDIQAAEFRPHRYPRRCVAYTGTHDNDTIRGWFADDGPRSAEQAAAERVAALEYVAGPGRSSPPESIHREILRMLYGSSADTVIVPLQDVLGLDNSARMNQPGVETGNWTWRMPADALTADHAHLLAELARVYDRTWSG